MMLKVFEVQVIVPLDSVSAMVIVKSFLLPFSLVTKADGVTLTTVTASNPTHHLPSSFDAMLMPLEAFNESQPNF